MEPNGERFSVISRTSDSAIEDCTLSTPSQPISVIKKPLKPWVKSVRRSKHPKHIIVLEGEPITYKCTVCSTIFKSKSNCCYHKHCGNEEEKPFACSICDRKFSTKTHFSYHALMHSGLNPHKCSICGKSFKTNYKLRRHQQVHTGDMQKKFSCDICGRAFLRKSSIRVHKQVHTGVKPYQCNECPKAFREKKNLIFHLSHHTGIKNWICEICGRAYVLKRDLELHKRTHSRVRPYLCTVSKCQQTFSQRRYLKRHMETHKSCLKFICNLCEKEFSRKDNLQRHIVNTHLESRNPDSLKAEKTNCILQDTAPYIKTIRVRDEEEESDEVSLVEQNVPITRTQSVIMSATRTDGVTHVRLNHEENLCNRISVIKTLADIASHERDDSEEFCGNDLENHNDIHPSQFKPQINGEQNADYTPLTYPTIEPVHSDDTMHFHSCQRLHNSELSYDEGNNSHFSLVKSSRCCDDVNEVCPHHVDLVSHRTESPSSDYVYNSMLPKLSDSSNHSSHQCTSFESTGQVNRDNSSPSYYNCQQFEGIILEQGTIADQTCSRRNEASFILHCDSEYLSPSFGEGTSHATLNHDRSSNCNREASECDLERRSPHPIYHNLTNGLSINPHPSFIYSNENTATPLSSVIIDQGGESETNGFASHFVPHFAPERMPSEIVKSRCMLPKKVIAASYRNCIAHEIVNTRAGWLDTTTTDSYKLLDLSMKSQ